MVLFLRYYIDPIYCIYTNKLNERGEPTPKARYVGKGFEQQPQVDYKETFSPTARRATLRMGLQIAVEKNMLIHQMDFDTAFLNADLDVVIYMKPPEGFTQNGKVWKLKKSQIKNQK